ncbi:unnamed protein product, partial [Polarella glacialis]
MPRKAPPVAPAVKKESSESSSDSDSDSSVDFSAGEDVEAYEEAEAARLKTPSLSPAPSPSPEKRQKRREKRAGKDRKEDSKKRRRDGRDEAPSRHHGRADDRGCQDRRRAAREPDRGRREAARLVPRQPSRSRSRRRRRRGDSSARGAHHAAPSMMPPPWAFPAPVPAGGHAAGGQYWRPPQMPMLPPPPASLPSGGTPAKPAIPMLHSIVSGDVQIMTPKGALMKLSDGSPMCYLDGLLRRRPGMPALQVGSRVRVKVVRIEAGMVIVDQREVEQRTGKDNDPENERAEVEEWVDVPASLVGRVIGKGGATIRKICDDTGADLRFDEASASKPAPGQLPAGGAAATSAPRKKTTGGHLDAAPFCLAAGGAGADLRAFLEAAREDEEAEDDGNEQQNEGSGGRGASASAPGFPEPKQGDSNKCMLW